MHYNRFVSFTFDDGDYQTALEADILLGNEKATFYVVKGWVDNSTSINDEYNKNVNHGTITGWQKLSNNGHEIGSHTVTHCRPDYHLADEEYKESLDYIKQFHSGPYSISMPWHLKSNSQILLKYDTVRRGNNILYNNLKGIGKEIGSWSISPHNLENIFSTLRDKVPSNTWVVFCLHGLNGRLIQPWSTNQFQLLLSITRGLGYKTITVRDMRSILQ